MTDAQIIELLKKAGIVECVLPFSEGSMQILRRFVRLIEAHRDGRDELITRPDGLAELPKSDAMQALEHSEMRDEP